jgi:hypothetical protein
VQRHIPEDDILHSHRCESLKSYKFCHVTYFLSRSVSVGATSCFIWRVRSQEPVCIWVGGQERNISEVSVGY